MDLHMGFKSIKFAAVTVLMFASAVVHASDQCVATISEDKGTIDVPCLMQDGALLSGSLKSEGENRFSLDTHPATLSSGVTDVFSCAATVEKKADRIELHLPCIATSVEKKYADGVWTQANGTTLLEMVWLSSANTDQSFSENNYHARAAVSTSKFDQWQQRAVGVCKDMDGSYGCQCVDLAHNYIQDVLGVPRSAHNIRGNAFDLYANIPSSGKTIAYGNVTVSLSKIPNTPTGVPQKGDIIFWAKSAANGYAGHVAIFVSGNVNSFTSLDQNWFNASPSRGSKAALVTHNYSGVVGWLRPDIVGGATPVLPTPPTVANISPSNGASFQASTTQVPLAWRASSDATNYRVVVSTKEDFSGFNDDLGSSACDASCSTWATTSTSGVFTQAKPGKIYYWNIRANNSNASLASSFTEAWSFNVAQGSTTIASPAEQKLNQCYAKFAHFFGSKVGGLIQYQDHIGQETSGTNQAPGLIQIAIRKDLSDNQFFYYWDGWGVLSVDYCN